MKAVVWNDSDLGVSYQEVAIPDRYMEAAVNHRNAMIELVADHDDIIMEKYLSEQEIDITCIKRAIREATIKLRLVPVYCGAALRNKGIQPLLDGIVEFLPSPLDVPPVQGINPKTKQQESRLPSIGEPFSALAFKIAMEQGRKMTYLRIYSGAMDAGSTIFNSTKNIPERAARILRMHANKRERIDQAICGDIVAVMGLKGASTGDTLCDEAHPILLESMKFDQPVISMAVELRQLKDQDKLMDSLAKLADEDPTFRFAVDEDTGQTIISGMGELHLEVLVQRLKREFYIDVNTGKPQVVYRETISKKTLYEKVFDREWAGELHYAGVEIEIAPMERGKGNLFVNASSDPLLTEEFLSAITQGVEEASGSGVIMGYPVIDLNTTLLGIKAKEGISASLSFKIAASMAFKEACEKAEPLLLEPIMRLEIVVPEEFLGDVINDLNTRGGRIEQIETKGTVKILETIVPLSKMFGYSTALRSSSQGRATFTMQFSHYDKV
jgi:elongation factor G